MVAQDTIDVGAETVKLEGKSIDTVVLRPVAQTHGRNTWLYSICYEAPLNAERERIYEEWVSSVDGIREQWRSTDNLLDPDFYYKLTVRTEVMRNGNPGPAFEESACFRVGQPPGASGELRQAESQTGFPAAGPLADLAPYVAYTVPASEARAVYRAYDVGVHFNENYVDAMYRRARQAARDRAFRLARRPGHQDP